ncbi:MAG: hypothetical protein HOI34_20225 [Rhodospirillaceae bacterium]|jgi:hypothetical protein|nr:hypothetical protein [Rhodospirillaceae bacterium]MBT6206005.1 hypothetical protein [Rhodospirillaceae bacterium]MBT6510962.1 hypothetical protein [Rhodospirillaceae bacterium]
MPAAAQHRPPWWKHPPLAGLALAIISAVLFAFDGASRVWLQQPVDWFNWLAGAFVGSVVLGLALAWPGGLRNIVQPPTPGILVAWMISRGIFAIGLAYAPSPVALVLVLAPFLVFALAWDREKASSLVIGAAILALPTVTVFHEPLILVYGIENIPSLLWLTLVPLLSSIPAWGAVICLALQIVLGRRLAKSWRVGPMMFWDGITLGAALLVLVVLESGDWSNF